jgi:hypothetical protein
MPAIATPRSTPAIGSSVAGSGGARLTAIGERL